MLSRFAWYRRWSGGWWFHNRYWSGWGEPPETKWSRTKRGVDGDTSLTIETEHHGRGSFLCALLDHLYEEPVSDGPAARRGVLEYCVRCRAEVRDDVAEAVRVKPSYAQQKGST